MEHAFGACQNGGREKTMAKRSQALKDSGVAVQEVGDTRKAANGGSLLPPPIVPEMPDAPPGPANDSRGVIGNGSPQVPPEAAVSEIAIPPQGSVAKQVAHEEPAPQPAEGSLGKRVDGSVRPAAHAAEESPRAERREIRVADIGKNRQDGRGENIDFVYFTRRNFAIYRSSGRILVQYADGDAESKKQIANIAELLPLRDRLQYVLSDMKRSQDTYHWQIAESLRLGLVGQKDAAKRTMQAAIDNIIAVRVSDGRTAYLLWAALMVMGAVALLGSAAIATHLFPNYTEQLPSGLNFLMLATGSGAIGAMLSTAIALRARTVGTDASRQSNVVDSATRIMIGVISAAVLYVMLDSNLLDSFSVSVKAFAKNPSDQIWELALLTGFSAGFLERLVPNLLENKLAPAMVK
jgi:hypothetical protein